MYCTREYSQGNSTREYRTRILSSWQYTHFLITFFLHTRTRSTRTCVILYLHSYTRVALLAIGTVYIYTLIMCPVFISALAYLFYTFLYICFVHIWIWKKHVFQQIDNVVFQHQHLPDCLYLIIFI